MDVTTGPCQAWPVTGCGGSPPVTGAAVAAATEVLWALSGRQFGFCDVPIRPCLRDCAGSTEFDPWWWDGSSSYPLLPWVLAECGQCRGSCECSTVSSVILPGYAHEVMGVTIDGVTLDSGAYWLQGHRRLIRSDGGSWPRCQDFNVTSGDGTWIVVTRFGLPIPEVGMLAASELATQIALACDNSGDCSLPSNVIEVTRAGVTYNMGLFEYLEKGKTGMLMCDLFLASYNPSGLRRRSRVYSPDL